MIWAIILIILAMIFCFYGSWMGYGIVTPLMITVFLVFFIPFFFPFISTTVILPLLGPIVAFFILSLYSPIIGSFVIPVLVMFALITPVFGVPFFSQTGIITFIVVAGGILLAIFGSPVIATTLI